MNLKDCERKAGCTVEMVVEVGPEEFDAVIGKAFLKNRSKIAVPGFRKGKAPRKIVEKIYGDSIFHNDAFEMLLPDVFKYAEEESGLRLLGRPMLSDLDIKEGNAGVDITLTASYYPEVKIGEYRGLSAVMPDVVVNDKEIDAEVEVIRARNARIEKADRPAANGDIAVIDFEGIVDGEPFEGGKGENFELTLGSGRLIPGFEELVEGMAAGDEKDIDLVFPDDYKEPFAGKPVVFKVKVNDVKEKILPDLDDEFAKDVSEFDTLDEYRASLGNKLQEARRAEADAVFENALLEQIIGAMDAELPMQMLEEQMDDAANSIIHQIKAFGMDPGEYMKMMNLTPEQMRENTRPESERQVKMRLALEKIAKLEGIEASEEEIKSEYNRAALNMGADVGELMKSVPEDKVSLQIKLRHATKLVIDSAIVMDAIDAIDVIDVIDPPNNTGKE